MKKFKKIQVFVCMVLIVLMGLMACQESNYTQSTAETNNGISNSSLEIYETLHIEQTDVETVADTKAQETIKVTEATKSSESKAGNNNISETEKNYQNSENVTTKAVMVWIPETGSKYHRSSGCSNMKNPTKVTLQDAQSRGYTACKKCY